MAKLTADEQAALDALLAKQDAPDDDPPRSGREISVFVDLSDEKAVGRALKLGVLDRGDLDEFDTPADDDEQDGDGDGDGGDGKPRRKPDPAPRRRLKLSDRMLGPTDDD